MLNDIKFIEAIDKMNQQLKSILVSENTEMQQVIDWVLSEKGKQIRPKMLLMSSMYSNKKNIDATKFAAIIEIVHMASLIHDDIIDDSDMRRGKESVQSKFGKKMAVYAGDYMIFSALSACFEDFNLKYRCVLNGLKKLCNGELGQSSNLYNINISENQYLENISGKTAALFRISCELGAIVGGADRSSIKNLAEFGEKYGILFQIHDDILDYGDNNIHHDKPVFQDFKNGIYSLPIIYACEDTKIKEQMTELTYNRESFEVLREKVLSLLGITNWNEKFLKKVNEINNDAKKSLMSLKNGAIRAVFENMLDTIYNSTIKRTELLVESINEITLRCPI